MARRDSDPPRALALLRATFGDAPADADAALLLARATFRAEEPAACRIALDAYFARVPADHAALHADWTAEAWVLRGWIEERAGDNAAARPHYEKALALVPNYPWALLRLAGTEQAAGDMAAALEHAQAAVRERPGLVEGQFLLAQLFRRAGRAEDAERAARIHRLLNQSDDNTAGTPEAQAERVAALRELETLLPCWVEGRIELIRKLTAAGDAEGALACARRLVREFPALPEGWPLFTELLRRARGEDAARAELAADLAAQAAIPAEVRAILERIVAQGFPK